MGPSKAVEVTHVTTFEFVECGLIIKHFVGKFKSHSALVMVGIALKSLLKKLLVT